MNDLLLGNGVRASWTVEGGLAEAEAKVLAGDFCEVVLRVAAETESVTRVAVSLTPPEPSLLAPSARVLVLGESRTAGRGVVPLSELSPDGAPVTLDALAVVLYDGHEALLAGLGGFAPDFPKIAISDGQIAVSFEPGRALTETLELSIVVGVLRDAHALLEAYGDLLARGGRPVAAVPTGWNSWDYYQAAVTMDDLRAELAAIKASPLAGRLKYFCLDMGWEESWGDWRPNRSFPQAAEMAREIRAAGLEPGIWISPLQARTTLPVARHQREMFCHDESGQLVIASGHLLFDPTHPATQEWLFNLCRGLREGGFTLFKIDYLYRDYLNQMGQLHAPTGKAAAARLFLQIIRDAIGEDAHLLSCGAPLPAAFGLADSARIGTDIHNFWGHVRNCAVQISMNYWLSGRVWINDPDFALIRCPETTDDPYLNVPYTPRPFTNPEDFWMAGEEATLAELKTWLALVHLCGGSVFAADSIARLNAVGLGFLEKLLADPAAPARPLDLFENTPPRVWLADKRLGIINFADEPAAIALPAGLPDTGLDFWTEEPVTLGVSVTLPPHASLLLKL